MAQHMNQVELRFPGNREELIQQAVDYDETCISAGDWFNVKILKNLENPDDQEPLRGGP